MSILKDKNILLGVTGSIAAYKSVFLLRLLKKEGCRVKVLLTKSALDFITPLTFSTLSNNKVYIDFVEEENFEKKWSKWLGIKYSTFVNSGSSANFITISILKAINKKKERNEIIVPSLTWVSDINSVIMNGYKPVFVDIDLSTLSMSSSEVMKKINKKTRKIDALINNVGIAGPTGSLEKLKSEDWERTIQVDVNSHFYFTKKAIPLIKKSRNGSIINISSTAGILGFPLRSPYAASKWAIIGITKTLAMELGKYNIRVNAVCPGSIHTSATYKHIAHMGTDVEKTLKEFQEGSLLKRQGKPEEVAKAVLFLASHEDSSFITGENIIVDGGLIYT